MKPHLWIAYDYASISECLLMLDTILEQYSDCDIIHEISKPTLLQAALEEVPIVSQFRQRLDNHQMLVADFNGYDVPSSTFWNSLRRFYYADGADLVTVKATAPDEVVQEAIAGANADQKLVAFDLMTSFDDNWKARRAQELTNLGASLVCCHASSSEQKTEATSPTLIAKVCQQLANSSTQMIVTGDLEPSDISDLKPYVEQDQIFAIAPSHAITRSQNPSAAIAQFLTEINELVTGTTVKKFDIPQAYSDGIWAAIDELTRCL